MLQIQFEDHEESATYTTAVATTMKGGKEGDSPNHSHHLLRHHLTHPLIKNNSYTLVHTLPM